MGLTPARLFEFIGAMGGAGVMSYEVMLVPFDRVDVNAVFKVSSTLWKKVKSSASTEFNDFDANSSSLMPSGLFRGGSTLFAF